MGESLLGLSDYSTRKTWNEPNPRYGGQTEGLKAEYNIHDVRNNETKPSFGNESKYPLNHVRVTESGHIFEVDDSPKAERIHEYHKTGTFYEIDKAGIKTTRIVANNYTIVAGDDNVHIKGIVNLTIDSHCHTYIKGNWKVQVNGNKYETIHGNNVISVHKNQTETVNNSVTEAYSVANGDVSQTIGSSDHVSSKTIRVK